jgi:fumarate hydratase subunit beta
MREIQLPLSKETISSLQAYDRVLLSGTLLVGRDQVHRLLVELLDAGKSLPVSIEGETIYYMGPSDAPDGLPIGSCGPTTSARMDPFTPTLMAAGLVASIGKGPRSQAVVDSIVRHRGLYLVAFGGCGALYAKTVRAKHVVACEELGPEAMLRLEIDRFPAVVGIDCRGNSVFR